MSTRRGNATSIGRKRKKGNWHEHLRLKEPFISRFRRKTRGRCDAIESESTRTWSSGKRKWKPVISR